MGVGQHLAWGGASMSIEEGVQRRRVQAGCDGVSVMEGFRGFESDLRAPHGCSGLRRSLLIV